MLEEDGLGIKTTYDQLIIYLNLKSGAVEIGMARHTY